MSDDFDGTLDYNEWLAVHDGELLELLCLECGAKFETAETADPECEVCGGVDLELLED